jgi:hypothetical protein
MELGKPLSATSEHNRKVLELLLQRSEWLPIGQRGMVRAVYGLGQRAADVARMSRERAQPFRRRLRRIVRRVLTREFVFVVNNRERWTARRWRIASLIFVDGMSVKNAAKVAGVSYYAARQHRFAVLEMMRKSELKEAA